MANDNVGQGMLFEAPESRIPTDFSDTKKRSFSWAIGAINPIFAREHYELTDSDLEVVNPGEIQSALYGDSSRSINGLTVNPTEFVLIPRNPRAIGNRVANNTLRARALDADSDRRAASADRSAGHALIGYANREGLIGWLEAEEAKLIELSKEMKQPGFRHHLDATGWLMLLKGVIDISFENLMDVTALRRGWDDKTTETARHAMLFRLSKDRQQKRISYWRDMTGIALQYNERKQLIFKQQIKAARTIGEKALQRGTAS